MTALRETAQQALEALEMARRFVYSDNRPQCDDAIDALRAALAQPEPQPVAWRTFDGEDGYLYMPYEDNETYAAEWAQRNPRRASWVEPLYLAPPQRPAPLQRKPLTEQAIEQIANRIPVDDFVGPTKWHIKLVRAAERAHGIKE